MDDARGQSRPTEALRILLEKIATLTIRLQDCEQTIEQLEQHVAKNAVDFGEMQERLSREFERQIAGLSAERDLWQKRFISKQTKLLELLASELSTVRTMAESIAGNRQPETPEARSEASPLHTRQRNGDAAASAELDLLDLDIDVAGSFPEESAPPPDRTRDSQEAESWDWLESLPWESGDRPDTRDISFDDLDKRRS